MNPDAEAIMLSNIRAHYTDKLVLDIEHLRLCQHECTALIGSSGSGKTTLLRLVNGYVRPTAGTMYILGTEINARTSRRREVRRRVGFVFQGFNLVERATVFENVLWGRLGYKNAMTSLLGYFTKSDKEIAMQAIVDVDLLDQADQRCDALSGGQQQRVGIARAVAQEPDIILADEPVSSLDPNLADDVLQLLVNVSQKRSATLVISLHQPELARRYANRIIGLSEGQVKLDKNAAELNDADIQAIYERKEATTQPL